MQARLAKLLVCPRCGVSLQLECTDSQGETILEGTFRCLKCGGRFPIRGGIPRFAPETEYVSSFSFEWKRWRRTQFDTDSRQSSAATFLASTGRLPEDLKGKTVLDAGCGAGRYMDLAAQAGAEVIGVDLSLAVEVARENLGNLPNSHFIQADLLHLPFPSGIFDFVYSIGVLDHTPETQRGFSALVPTVKPRGELAIWVYPRYRLAETFRYFPRQVNEVLARDVSYRLPPRWQGPVRRVAKVLDWMMEVSSSFQRVFTTRLPPRALFWLCHAAIPLYYLYRIPLFYPLRLVTKIAMDPDPEWRVLDTFDWYSSRYQWKHTYSEVKGWFEAAGFEELTILPRPVAVRGRKAAH